MDLTISDKMQTILLIAINQIHRRPDIVANQVIKLRTVWTTLTFKKK